MSGYALREDKQGWRLVEGPEALLEGETFSELEPELTIEINAPQSVTMMQARLAMIDAGIFKQVVDAIDAMTGVDGLKAQQEWATAAEVRRERPLVASLQAALKLSDREIDNLFIAAAAIQ